MIDEQITVLNIEGHIQIMNERNRILTEGTEQEIIDFAKEWNIFQVSKNNRFYDEMCQKIRDRLSHYNIDPETLR